MNKAPVITIDGPSGSGKGTIAELIAAKLNYHLLDSGALYRLLALNIQQQQIKLTQLTQISALALKMQIRFGEAGSVSLNGQDVTLAIRGDHISALASQIAVIDEVRKALFERQLAFRLSPGLVADGRDMGTVVFPDARLKIFLTASVQERADRRYKQLIAKGISVNLPTLLRQLEERDERDSSRSSSPLVPAKAAVILDTTRLTIQQVVSRILAILEDK